MSFLRICEIFLMAGMILVCGCRNSQNLVRIQKTENPALQKSCAEASREQKTENSGQKTEMLSGEAHIQFEAMEYNLDSIGPMTIHDCEFRLKNTGSSELAITDVKIGQDCARWSIDIPDHATFAPGESGILTIPYTAKQRLGETTEYVYVRTNDSANPVVKLVINATVEDKVYYEPRHIRFAFDKPNAACGDIILASTDGRPFSIKKIISTGDILLVNIDPSAKEKQFVLHPAVILSNLRKKITGNIRLVLDHPDCENIVIGFEAIPEFRTVPAALTLVNTIPGKAVTKQLKILTNYTENFTIESVKSQNNLVEAVEQKTISGGFVITLKIIPPDITGDSFDDTIILQTSDDRIVEVKCTGLYKRSLHESVACENRKK